MKSKVEKIGDVFTQAIRQAIDDIRLTELDSNNRSEADALKKLKDRIVARATYLATGPKYQRLELSDIIRGHKRGWAED